MADGEIVIEITADTAAFTAQLQLLAASAQQTVTRWLGGVEAQLPRSGQVGQELVTRLISGMAAQAGALRSQAVQLVSGAYTAARGISFAGVGSNMVSGIISGVSGSAGRLYASLRSLAQGALAAAKQALGIASPSRRFRDEVGRWIPDGIGEGVTAELPALSALLRRELEGLTAQAQYTVQSAGGTVLPMETAEVQTAGNRGSVPDQQVLLQLDSRTVARAVAHDVGGYLEWEVL